MLEDLILFIPARKNSKGLPFKNRALFNYTASKIPINFRKNVFISTDDEEIKTLAKKYNFFIVDRKENLCKDETSTKDVLLDFIKEKKIENKIIVLLYLTYPERTWEDVEKIFDYFYSNKCESLLCKKSTLTHPFLMMYDVDNDKGKQLIKHNLYRRQDYPKCFEISHFVGIFKSNVVKKLNKNLYNTKTNFYPIDNVIDVDYQKDLEEYVSKNNSRNRDKP